MGSNNQWAFENDVLKKLPQTAVHTFDCTLGTHVDHAVRSGKVRGLTFHDACLGMKDVDLQPPAPRAKNATRAPMPSRRRAVLGAAFARGNRCSPWPDSRARPRT